MLGTLPHLQTICTIGTNKLSAQEFFVLLKAGEVAHLIDIRRLPNSPYSRFATKRDLPYLCKLHEISYAYLEDLAPSRELIRWLKSKNQGTLYERTSQTWRTYTRCYRQEIKERAALAPNNLEVQAVLKGEAKVIAFLCTEEDARICHRSLAADYVAYWHQGLQVKHLTTKDIVDAYFFEEPGESFCIV